MKKDTVDEVADRMLALEEGTRVQVLFPLQPPPKPCEPEKVKGRRPAKSKKKAIKPAEDALLKERLFELRKRGFNRLYQNGQVFEFSTPESLLDVNFAEPVYLLVDRIAVSPEVRARIVDAMEHGYREAGEVIFETVAARRRATAAAALFAALRVQELRHQV